MLLARTPLDCSHPTDPSACSTFHFGWPFRSQCWWPWLPVLFWVCPCWVCAVTILPLPRWALVKSFVCWRVQTSLPNTLEVHRESLASRNLVLELSRHSSEQMCHVPAMGSNWVPYRPFTILRS